MPRFAANLSLSPIEPMKPSSTQSSTAKPSPDVKQSILQPTKVLTETVPEAEFDWNSSGLVNPLDGESFKYLLFLRNTYVFSLSSLSVFLFYCFRSITFDQLSMETLVFFRCDSIERRS
jgi:hypothetical protein